MNDQEAENNFPPDFLCQSHLDFVIGWMELQRQNAPPGWFDSCQTIKVFI